MFVYFFDDVGVIRHGDGGFIKPNEVMGLGASGGGVGVALTRETAHPA